MKILITVIAVCLFLTGCEAGKDPNGPYKSYLVLQDAKGEVFDFYLGGYNTLHDCTDLLEYETGELKAGKYFWTNPGKNYGGSEQEGWIKHEVIGSKCVFTPQKPGQK